MNRELLKEAIKKQLQFGDRAVRMPSGMMSRPHSSRNAESIEAAYRAREAAYKEREALQGALKGTAIGKAQGSLTAKSIKNLQKKALASLGTGLKALSKKFSQNAAKSSLGAIKKVKPVAPVKALPGATNSFTRG